MGNEHLTPIKTVTRLWDLKVTTSEITKKEKDSYSRQLISPLYGTLQKQKQQQQPKKKEASY
jgi:hypothetical protein